MSDRTPTAGRDERPSGGDDRDQARPPGPAWRVTPAPDGRGADAGDHDGGERPQARPWLPLAVVFLVMLGLNYALSQQALGPAERVRIPYQPTFLEQIRDGNVRSISSQDEMVQGDSSGPSATRPTSGTRRAQPTSTPTCRRSPTPASWAALLREHDVTVNARPPDTGAPLWETLLVGLAPTILLFALLFWLFRRATFRQAKEAAPAIIFIDELDAIGRRRGGNAFAGGSDEREQTLNQILTEMDGFDPRSGIVVLAATNRPDVLDPALLRPGRFDRRVHVSAPDKDGRRQILAVHTRSLPLDADVDLDVLAATTPGMVGADLANLANEAALTAAGEAESRSPCATSPTRSSASCSAPSARSS